jgi:tetratricopeptide (TPR) repeat protein
MDWSYQLLDADERALLARLSVFAGGWTIEAAEAMGIGPEPDQQHPVDVLTTLSSLVNKSLVMVDDGGSAGPRFRMLGAVAEYAAERLDDRGQRVAALDRLVEVVGRLVEDAADGMRTAHRPWAARLDDELSNVRAAWRHTIARDRAEIAYRIFIRLAYYFWSRSLLPELVAVVNELVALPSASRLDEAAHGRLLWGQAITNLAVGRVDGVRPMLEEALRIGDRLGDLDLVVRVSTGLSYLAGVHDAPEARQTLEKSVTQLRLSGDLANTAYTLATLAQLARRSGDVERATALYEECLGLAEQVDNEHLQTLVLHQLGFTALLEGKPTRAREYFQASVAANLNLLDQEGLAYCLDGFAAVAQADGNPQAAVRLHAAAAHRRDVIGISTWPELQPLLDEWVDAARSALEKPRFEQEWAAGTRMRSVDVLAYAQDVTGLRT